MYAFETIRIVTINSHVVSAAHTLVMVGGGGEAKAKEIKEANEAEKNQPPWVETEAQEGTELKGLCPLN